MANPIIELKGITKTFGTGDGAVTALKDVDLTIYEGEIFGVIGLSGAGKSTLVRCINLLEKPTAGTQGADEAFREGAPGGAAAHRHDLPELQPAAAAERPR